MLDKIRTKLAEIIRPTEWNDNLYGEDHDVTSSVKLHSADHSAEPRFRWTGFEGDGTGGYSPPRTAYTASYRPVFDEMPLDLTVEFTITNADSDRPEIDVDIFSDDASLIEVHERGRNQP